MTARPSRSARPRVAALLVLPLLVLAARGAVAAPQGLLDALRGGTEAQGKPEATEPPLAERQARTAERLADVEARLATARDEGKAALALQLESERTVLQRIQLRQSQLESTQARVERLREEKMRQEEALGAVLAGTQPGVPEADLDELEKARDRLDAARADLALLERAVKAAQQQKRAAESSYASAETLRRKVQDEVAGGGDTDAQALAQKRLRERELASQAELELLHLRDAEVEAARLEEGIRSLAVREQEAEVERMAENVQFLEEDRTRIDQELTAHRKELEQQEAEAQDAFEALDRPLADVKSRLEEAQEPSPQLEAEEGFYELSQELARQRLDVIRNELDRVDTLREAWSDRFRLAQTDVNPTDSAAIGKKVDEWLDVLDLDEDRRTPELSKRQDQLQEAQAKLDALGSGAGSFDRDRVQLLGKAVETLRGAIADVASTRRVVLRLRQELQAEREHVSLGERLAVVRTWILRAWNTELLSVGDAPITVRKVVLGLTIMILGGWLAKRLSRWLGRWLLSRFHVDEGGLAVAQTLTFYALVLLFVLLALRVVNVPLTAFTIFGGAIAIGVGFGSQNLINNFISGLILLMERPVRVGDLIQVGELQGNVERIGARSTIVRTGSNIEIVVPNAAFLEQNVVNWTLSEPKVRVSVRVGVAYGSPTRDVAKLLRRAADEHGRILKTPEPIVLFQDFGNDALMFEVHFWIRMHRVMDRMTIESDLRFIVDGFFRDAGVTIAYPQRDLHLDTTRPLEVSVRATDEDAETAARQGG